MTSMSKLSAAVIEEVLEGADQRVFLHDVPWSQYEALLSLRGDSSMPRMTYLEGTLELMTTSRGHETTKKTIARLVEAYAEEIGVGIWGYGSWTLKRARKKRGAEPDESYSVGAPAGKVPDLAIEVVWTRGGIDKLEIYRKLGVREVWNWENGAISVFELRGDEYEAISKSLAFPKLDLGLLARLATDPDQPDAVRKIRASANARRGQAR